AIVCPMPGSPLRPAAVALLAGLISACGAQDASTRPGTGAGGGAGAATGGGGNLSGGGGAPSGGAGGTTTGGSGGATTGGAGASESYADATFFASHNSYSPGPELGTLQAQLDAGVRFVEFDVHDNDFASQGYRVGHDAPGNEVALGAGNPNTLGLSAWLKAIATWSSAHKGHAPITIGLDLKDSLEDNPSYAAGNLAALNDVLLAAFGNALFPEPDASTALPTVAALRDRVVVVLSGDHTTRLAYVRDTGKNPSVALNAAGQVLEIHDSGAGDLWYWSGSLTAGAVRFARHSRYDTGKNPAVLLDDSGVVVEVHEHPSTPQLFYRVGRLTSDQEVTWQDSAGKAFPGNDGGQNPSLAWVVAGSALREVHKSQNSSQNWYWDGALNAAKTDITWTRKSADGGKTSDPAYDATRSSAGGNSVQVSSAGHGPFSTDVLLVALNAGKPERIRYPQQMFVEVQPGNAMLEKDNAWFFAADARSATDRAWATGWRSAGKLVRFWVFNDVKYATAPPPSFGATDAPLSSWYQTYCAGVGCVAF
ncbi:MAG TPA: hypothetical protein PKD61_03225, partial [Polyangiaceae bacterium]|nr:hypothetical protein [Polyangiaceae bacterium]